MRKFGNTNDDGDGDMESHLPPDGPLNGEGDPVPGGLGQEGGEER